MEFSDFDFPRVRVSLPPEMKSKHDLFAYLGVNDAEIRKIRYFAPKMYTAIDVVGKSKKIRRVLSPQPRLKHIQRLLHLKFISIYKARNAVHGFVTGKSVKTNAESHVGRRYLLNCDITDFFGTISENRILGLLESIGIPNDVAKIISYITCVNGVLPQGAPTSPILSNMICFRLDRDLRIFCKANRLKYTRYADDISLSSHSRPFALFIKELPDPGYIDLESLSVNFRRIFTNNGFTLNPKKLRFSGENSKKMVTGCIINEFANVPRPFIREIRATLHRIKCAKVDPSQAPKVTSSYASLRGKIEWVAQIKGRSDPVYRKLAEQHNLLFSSSKILIEPTEEERLQRSIWVIEHMTNVGTTLEVQQGTAFFVKGVGLLSALHCVDGAKELEIYHYTRPANRFLVEVKKTCKHRDLALMSYSLPTTEFFELELATSSARTGSNVDAFGFPHYHTGDTLNIRNGNITSRKVLHSVRYIELNQLVVNGMSGGPVLNHDRQVVGIIHKGAYEGGRNLAICVESIREWLSAK